MIFLLITLHLVTAQNVFYAVEDVNSKKFAIFSKISQCRIFVNMENKVIYKLENKKWKIGQITKEGPSKKSSETCFHLVERLNIENEYKLNGKGNRLTDISYWQNLKDKDGPTIKIRTRKIYRNVMKGSLKLIEGTKNSSSTWKECQNLVLHFYKNKNTQIIVSFQENAEECFHSDDFSIKLEHKNNAYVKILESSPDKNGNPKNKTNDEVEDVDGVETTTSSDITNKPDNIPVGVDKLNLATTDSASVNVTLYTSIGLGVLAIVLLGLIILFIVKLRKQNNVPVIINYEYYLGSNN